MDNGGLFYQHTNSIFSLFRQLFSSLLDHFLEQQQQQPEQRRRKIASRRLFRAELLQSKFKPKNITCPELNVTFTNEPPFDILGIPGCGDKVQPELMIYYPYGEVDKCQLKPSYLPNNETDLCIDRLNELSTVKKLVVVTHGFTKSFETWWLHQFQRDIQSVEADTAVLVSKANRKQIK